MKNPPEMSEEAFPETDPDSHNRIPWRQNSSLLLSPFDLMCMRPHHRIQSRRQRPRG